MPRAVAAEVVVEHNGLDLTVSLRKRSGSDHLVLFLPGLGCAKESFDGAFTAPGLAAYSLCAVDFLGCGSSAKPEAFSYRMEDHAAVVRRVVNRLSPKAISIVAHSMGGAIGVLLARELPSLMRFVSVEGNLVAEDCGLASRRMADQPLESFERRGYGEFIRDLRSSDREDFHIWAESYARTTPRAVHASARSLVEWSDSGKLLEIFNDFPNKTYIFGDEEPKDYLLPRFQDVEVRHIAKLGHFMMTEDPPAFFEAVSVCLGTPSACP